MFYQKGPELKNQFTDDKLLTDYLKTTLPADVFKKISPHLEKVGAEAATTLMEWAVDAEANVPVLVQYDPWGNRIDEIRVSQGWKNFDAYSASNAIVAAGYEREFQEYSRVYQMTLLYLFHPSSAVASCPLAMTDGAARAIELYGDESMKNRAFKNLTSRDPKKFWTSGQWMTERSGGSDVGGTETVAKKNADGSYSLFGDKWFTSATTSQMAMTLARIEGHPEGSKGLSLFYLETRDANGKLNNIEINRLKDKLGTKALPTAELSLKGTKAQLVGGEGQGVRKISSLFNITRVYNAICSVAQMRRGLALSYDYAEKRVAFGKKLVDHPLHMKTLKDLSAEYKACFHLTFKAVELLGKDECGKTSESEKALLRVLTPLAKLFTAKSNVKIASEVLESFGGAGYVEDSGIPRLLRDGQVLAIWEGTTNVLSLDMLRAFQREQGLEALNADMTTRIQALKNSIAKKSLSEKWNEALADFKQTTGQGEDAITERAREFALSFSKMYTAGLMYAYADKTGSAADLADAELWEKQFRGS